MQTEKINIFYTDDDPEDIALFREATEEATKDVELLTQFDGGDLLQLLQNPPPSPAMVFLDWNMPGKDGKYVLKSVRQNQKTKDIPIIVFSTSNNPMNIAQARELGANLYITKPTSFKDLIRMIRHCITIDWNNFNPSPQDFVFRLA